MLEPLDLHTKRFLHSSKEKIFKTASEDQNPFEALTLEKPYGFAERTVYENVILSQLAFSPKMTQTRKA